MFRSFANRKFSSIYFNNLHIKKMAFANQNVFDFVIFFTDLMFHWNVYFKSCNLILFNEAESGISFNESWYTNRNLRSESSISYTNKFSICSQSKIVDISLSLFQLKFSNMNFYVQSSV